MLKKKRNPNWPRTLKMLSKKYFSLKNTLCRIVGDLNSYTSCPLKTNAHLLRVSPTGPYLLGKEISIADIAAAPFVARQSILTELDWLHGINNSQGPEIDRYNQWVKELIKRTSVSKTTPMAYELITYYKRV